MRFQRREFVRQSAGALAGAGLFRRSSFLLSDKLPPVRAITHGPKYHWFGYYDKLQFDPTSRYVLGNEVDFEHRSPKADDRIRIGLIDLHDGDRWTEIGESLAWNWQQGCMLQWLPGSSTEVIWNDRQNDKFISRILNVKTGKSRTLPEPIYAISPDATTAVLPDFKRLNATRPGYGYAGLPDPYAAQAAPKDSGIRQINLKTGKTHMLVSLAEIAEVPYKKDVKYFNDPAKSKHWFNHLLYNKDGSRFLFLHRWRQRADDGGTENTRRPFSTRMFTCNSDGSDLYVVDHYGQTSHFIWRDSQHICAWAWHPSHGEKFYLFRDRSEEVEVVGPDVMTVNGHNTYLPGNEWILNDTYPDSNRLQHPYLYQVATGHRVPLGHFHSPPQYTGEWRCDTHPRFSPDGQKVVIDSPHEGGRQMYLIDISKARE